MTFFAQDEAKQLLKPCRVIRSVLKDAITQCLLCKTSSATSDLEEEYSVDDEQEVIIHVIRRAMEAKMQRKGNSFNWVILPPMEGELVLKTAMEIQQWEEHGNSTDEDGENEEQREDYFSMKSCFSQCSSASKEALFSARSYFSRCSSAGRVDVWDVHRQSIIKGLCHCEGWPFGLFRRAILLPPLPDSPSDSWTWCSGSRMVKMI